MRRVLLCLLTLPFALNLALAQAPDHRTPPPPGLPWHRTEPPPPPQQPPYQCNSTKPSGALTLQQVLPPDGVHLEYAGTLLTWTPNGNETECHIRQIIFNVPDTMDNGTLPCGSVAPDINIQLFHHGGKQEPVGQAQNFDMVLQQNGVGLIQYRIDIQTPEPLYGDYDLKIDIVGLPKPPCATTSTKK
jgi:hypothetical protein